MHARLWPKAHRFTHAAFACAVEPGEFGQLGRGRWLLGRRWSPYAFRDQDFLPAAPLFQPEGTPQAFGPATSGLDARVRAFCAAQGEPLPATARVTLVAMPRAFGKSYNPAVFFLITVDGELRCGIAEVHNTFGERKAWFLGAACRGLDEAGRPCLRLRTPKRFYVSPFSALDTEFEFTLRLPKDARQVVRAMADKGVLGGVSLGRLYPGVEALAGGLVVAVTETVTPEDVETLAIVLGEELA